MIVDQAENHKALTKPEISLCIIGIQWEATLGIHAMGFML